MLRAEKWMHSSVRLVGSSAAGNTREWRVKGVCIAAGNPISIWPEEVTGREGE